MTDPTQNQPELTIQDLNARLKTIVETDLTGLCGQLPRCSLLGQEAVGV